MMLSGPTMQHKRLGCPYNSAGKARAIFPEPHTPPGAVLTETNKGWDIWKTAVHAVAIFPYAPIPRNAAPAPACGCRAVQGLSWVCVGAMATPLYASVFYIDGQIYRPLHSPV